MDETNVTEKKPRKVVPKAPNRAKDPKGYQNFQINRAMAILQKVEKQTRDWSVKASFYANEACDEANRAINEIDTLPVDFKAPRAKGKGGGRTKVVFTIGQDVTLNEAALARVQTLFPDVTGDCHFRIATNAKETDKLLPIVCTGIDGNLAPFFVDRAKRSELKPKSA